MEQQPITKLKVPFHTFSLTKESLRKLLDIVSKVKANDPGADVSFEIEGGGETVAAESIDAIVNSRLPRDLKEISLWARSGKGGKRIYFCISDIGDALATLHMIEVEARDTDWVNARVKELEDFMSDHGNFHWIFQNWASSIIQAIGFGTLIALSLRAYDWGSTVGTISGFLYFPIVKKLFPAVVLDTERQSSIKTIRKVLVLSITAIFVGLVTNLLVRLIWNI